ncbi:hypothetical protein NUACC21_41190 [Scytonema sp. NUACC21]
MVTIEKRPLFTAVTTEESAVVRGGDSSAIPIDGIRRNLAVKNPNFGTGKFTFVELSEPTQTVEILNSQLHIGPWPY